MSERDEDGNERFLSLAPLSVRGPFSIFDNVREQVSKDRLRYRMDGFNLDLRYITPNIIAMAAPSDRGITSFTTNHVDEVTRFMTLKHDNKVMYYNLIGEADAWTFESHRLGIVNHQFAFLDHSVPSISQMQAFCLSVKQWLESDVSNVAVVMCKSGRNRTAIMACAYLLYRWPQEFGTASEVIDYFSHRRMRRGQAVQQPCQRRWISYFSQRFAAVPQSVKLSKLVIPQGPLKAQKLRLTIHMLVPGSQKGNAVDEELLWTSKGRGMGGLERGESYTVFNFPEAIEVTGDIKVTIWTRKFSNGPFLHAFHLWFNTGFVDHTPMVWDKSCFDGLPSGNNLPDDFHIQTLFVGFPRVACSLSKVRPARIYCWDCDDPFLSEEDSITMHKRVTTIGEDGEVVEMNTGPRHRYHPLIEEECALCERRRQGWTETDAEGKKIVHKGIKAGRGEGHSTIEARKKHIAAESDKSRFESDAPEGLETKVYSAAEGVNLISKRKEITAREKEREMRMYASKDFTVEKAPIYNFPSVYCEDTKQYLCTWCNANALGEDSKKYTRISIPLIPSSDMRYSGCARQVC